jgi:hypothetical protein
MNRSGSDGDSREALATEANRVRARLLRTVEALDRKRHELVEIEHRIRHHLRSIALGGMVAFLIIAGGVFVVAHRIAHAADRRRRGRWHR